MNDKHISAARLLGAHEDGAWDRFLMAQGHGHHVQSTLWARCKAAAGWKSARVVIEDNDGILAGAQVLFRPLPVGGSIGYAPRGPVFRHYSDRGGRAILHGLGQLVRDLGLKGLIVQAPPNDALVSSLHAHGYRMSPVAVATAATTQVDLSRPEGDLLAGMSKKHRQSLRRAAVAGLEARLGTDRDLAVVHALHVGTATRRGFKPQSMEQFEALWAHFHPGGHAQLVLSENQGRPVAGQLVVAFGEKVTAKFGGWSGELPKSGPNHLMDWTTMLWAKSEGYRWYDFEGIPRSAAELASQGRRHEIEQGSATYKLDFGGEVVQFPEPVALIPNRVFRWAFSEVMPMLRAGKTLRRVSNRLRTA